MGMGYVLSDEFKAYYDAFGINCASDPDFYNVIPITMMQLKSDKEFLYGVLQSATQNYNNHHVMANRNTRDGFKTWFNIKKDNEHSGSTNIKLEELETHIHTLYDPKMFNGIGDYLTQFQSWIEELKTLPIEDDHDVSSYTSNWCKRKLLTNLSTDPDLNHLVSQCYLNKDWTFLDSVMHIKVRGLAEARSRDRMRGIKRIQHTKTEPMALESPADKKRVMKTINSMISESGTYAVYKTLQSQTLREQLNIPDLIWNELEPELRRQVIEARRRAREKITNDHNDAKPTQSSSIIPDQYPSMKSNVKQTMSEFVEDLVDDINDMMIDDPDLSEEDDEDAMELQPFVARMTNFHFQDVTSKEMITSGEQQDTSPNEDNTLKNTTGILLFNGTAWGGSHTTTPRFDTGLSTIVNNLRTKSTPFGYSDGCADVCVIGNNGVFTEFDPFRTASLIGFDPAKARSDKLKIGTGWLKAESNVPGCPVILKIHEAVSNPTCDTTIISEYQVRERGYIVDSVATKHKKSEHEHGTQRIQLNDVVHLPLVDLGGDHGLQTSPVDIG